jgi:1,4-dihydroxy-2-naphthoate octaprenyltransferase
MAEYSEAARPAESLRRALVHLRLKFSLVLTPLFLWGIYLALPGAGGSALPWPAIVVGYLIVHVPLYGGMNAFNSYYDRDEGPIGALAEPPPVDYTVLYVALICKAVALAAGLWLDVRFGLLVGAAILLSALYSHPRWRWKERPALAAATIFVGQGLLGVLWGYTAATWATAAASQASIWSPGWVETIGVLSAACWTLGFYPLTGVYQIATDGARGIRTLAVALGVERCFAFAAVVAALGGLGVWAVLLARGAYLAMVASALYSAWAARYTWRWRASFARATVRENQRALMRLSYANGLAFTLIFLALILWR